ENLIVLDDATHPVVDDPVTSREIINDFLSLIHDVQNVSTHEVEHKMLFGVCYTTVLSHPKADRNQLINTLRSHLNNAQFANFINDAAPGAGICQLRTEILAMTFLSPSNTLIPWELLPADSGQRTTALTGIRTALTGLSENNQIDLFNILRFPKASLKALDLVVANLLTRLFSGNSLETVMGNRNNADQLFNHLIHGPNAPDSTLPANPVTPNGIIARMVGPLWSQIARIAPVIPSATGSAITGDMPSLFGIPERIPEITYIVNALPGDNGFISSATNYHQAYGLSPHSFQSLEGLVGAIRTPDSHIGRLRIVGHVGLSDDSLTANLNAQFFNEGPRIIPEAMLRGFGISDEAGLRSILDETNYLNPVSPVYEDLVANVIQILKNLNHEVLIPFGTVSANALAGDFRLLMNYCSDWVFAHLGTITGNGTDINNTSRGYLKNTIQRLFNIVRDRLNGTTIGSRAVTSAEMDELLITLARYNKVQFSFLSLRPIPVFGSMVNLILGGLRDESANTPLLTKFCLQSNGPPSGSDLEKFLNICSDLYFLEYAPDGNIKLDGTNLTTGNVSQRNDLSSALNLVADRIRDRLSGTNICSGAPTLTQADVNSLRSAILALNPDQTNITSFGSVTLSNPIGSSNLTSTNNNGIPVPVQIFNICNTANNAVSNNFRSKLNQVKARFDENSWIDIRGCRIGQDTNYLEALRIFFGRPDHLPSVSGPEWWQSFPSAGFIPLADEAAVDTLWGSGDNTGHQGHTARDIQDVFDRVRSLSGVDIHIDFWKDVSNFSNFRFVAQVWKGELQPLPMQAPRLSDFNSLNFTNTINRISEIFNLAGSAPTGATLTRIQNNHTVIAALQSEVDNIQQLSGQSSPSSSALLASHNRLHAISTDLGQTTVPASAPAGLTAAQLSGWASALVTSVDTDIIGGGNNNTEIETFRQALHAKVNIPESDDSTATGNGRSDFRYYFFIGLPLLVEPLNNWFFYVLHAQRNEAIRSFMRAHWQDVLPTGNQVAASNINHERARQLSILTERDDTGTDTDDYVNPYPEFNQHIITRQ
ncbi:MAG: hypothetical protein PHG29_08620, partial [Prolixibacteraceae bacterium]|nr:hypothetical protein [Prolixibacteraceae bacterium]